MGCCEHSMRTCKNLMPIKRSTHFYYCCNLYYLNRRAVFSQIWKTWMDPGHVGERMVQWKLGISKKTLCSFELSIQNGEQVLLMLLQGVRDGWASLWFPNWMFSFSNEHIQCLIDPRFPWPSSLAMTTVVYLCWALENPHIKSVCHWTWHWQGRWPVNPLDGWLLLQRKRGEISKVFSYCSGPTFRLHACWRLSPSLRLFLIWCW